MRYHVLPGDEAGSKQYGDRFPFRLFCFNSTFLCWQVGKVTPHLDGCWYCMLYDGYRC